MDLHGPGISFSQRSLTRSRRAKENHRERYFLLHRFDEERVFTKEMSLADYVGQRLWADRKSKGLSHMRIC